MMMHSITQKTLKGQIPEFIFYSLLYTLILFLFIALLIPIFPVMISLGLDESWQFALNQAFAQHLVFGKDIIFTYGPYSFLNLGVYHPATDALMLMTSLYLALSYFGCFILVSKGARPIWILIFYIGFILVTLVRDSLFLIYPLLLGLAVFKIVSVEGESPYKSKWDLSQVFFIFFPLGLLALIKGTMLILSVLVAILCYLFLIINKKYYLAIAGFLSLIISTLFFWWLAGQPISNLPDFIINLLIIILGYSEAMQGEGKSIYIIIYILPASFLLISILLEKNVELTSKLFLFFLYFLFLFFALKVSFVLQNNHVQLAGIALITGVFLLPFISQSRMTMLASCFSIICGAFIIQQYTDFNWQAYVKRVGNIYASFKTGGERRLQDHSWPQHDYEIAVNTIKKHVPFPRLEGTTDIYSWNQAALLASGNTWSPRPIIQSYSAYTESLALKNRGHLLGNKAPNNIIFRIETLRNNLPSIEDGASWPVLLYHYQPVQMENGYLILRKITPPPKLEKGAKYESKVESFGKTVKVPYSSQLMFAKLEIHQTFLGWLVNMVFKSTSLHITLTLKSDEVKTYRIVSGMAEAGFLISPLVKDTKDFRELYEKENLEKNRVKYFSIEGNTMLWNDKYKVIFSENDI